MKTFLQILFLQCICFAVAAQQTVMHELFPSKKNHPSALRTIAPAEVIQNHEYAPEMILYDWDTLSSTWIYHYTAYMHFNSDSLMESDLAYDTVANVPISRDTTVFDSLGRILSNETQSWNAGWQNSFKLEHAYRDTNYFNRTTKYYNGSGNTWTLYHADSVYGLADINGNLIENYYDLFDIPSGIYKRDSKTLTDYDIFNHIQKRRAYQYDTTAMQYIIRSLDSNIVYDNVYTDQIIDQVNYNYNSGVQSPYLRSEMVFTGISEMDNIQTLKQYNLQQHVWDDYFRQTSTGQACNNLDSSLIESWSIGSGWQQNAGSRFIFNFIDSCDYDEIIIQNYISWLGTYRNGNKWVYPYPSTLDVPQHAGSETEVAIYPNPFHESAMLNSQCTMHNARLRIYNAMGALVRDEKIVNTNTYILHRKTLPDGMYFYKIISNDYELLGAGKFVIE